MGFIKNSGGTFGSNRKFAKGTRFNLSGKTWIVTEEFYSDNTDMRRVRSDIGDEEISTLFSLEKDSRAYGFRFLDSLDQIEKAKEVEAEVLKVEEPEEESKKVEISEEAPVKKISKRIKKK